MIIELPFPPKELSPNARLHWGKVSKVKKAYRTAAALITKLTAATEISCGDCPDLSGRLRLDFTFYPSSNYAYDKDGLLSRMKSAIDGIADGLGVNDKLFDIGNIDIAPKVPGGSVRVHITTVKE